MDNQNTNPPVGGAGNPPTGGQSAPEAPPADKKGNLPTIIVIVAIVVALLAWNKWGKKPAVSPAPGEEQTATTTEAGEQPSTDKTATTATTAASTVPGTGGVTGTGAKTGVSPSATLSYTKALSIYRKSGYYYQFYKCKGTPGSLTMKKGKQFMLDNRDAKAHTVAFGKQSYYVPKYGFAIATAKYVGKFFITCDGGGAAQILVEP
ncbi:hypothetical protein EPN28_03560 [Patescibacteria group bacterium]|nr:MAG: hypothetical protein EPN28_03560 [Patescibacteria group bacterium]